MSNWKNYQKEICDDNFYYARSCIRQNFFPGSENIFVKILREVLNKNVYDDAEHTTCTGIGYHSDVVPFETIQTVVARNFSLMSNKGFENLAISCVTSFGIYTEITETWKHFPEEEQKIRGFLKKSTNREFIQPLIMSHCSDIFYKFRNEIFEKAKYSLVNKNTGKPLKVVEHIGCHYAKMFPEKGVGGAEFPQVLAGMITAWGGEVVDYPERRHCCGFGFRQYLVKANRGYSISNSIKKFEAMKPYKPDFIVANCPGCAMFMDKWQYTAKEMNGETYGENGEQIPVLTYEEMAGLVLGYNPWDLGLQMHQIDCEPLLKKMHYEYNPEDKFRNLKGEKIGEEAKG
ncbi:MAG TPA: heterodisulfide reductase subunit B [Bacteroidales bacterium]|nr:MAG: heterodisulfide reductase subunit B [Bacteroidetes bacterium GWF2_33_38]OFY68201.1 MAG: heterodisulfide reductase subunit B [Bacteroidetes bacterium RIFOXYA12_FULL_33_9]OFY84851.1 MAG: heterodisulfide reductase subunit B [Bacteroidetes bacterium RIFOXYA2_FULL_33_7]HBF87506.1 heterodisulfide reductase subunit B [Bacteroidales bacterium]